MNEIIAKLVENLKKGNYLVAYDPHLKSKTSFTVSVKSPSYSIITWYKQIAVVEWSTSHIIVNFTPSANETDKDLVTSIFNNTKPNK